MELVDHSYPPQKTAGGGQLPNHLLKEISCLLRNTFDLDKLIEDSLICVTACQGLRFNIALLFLTDESTTKVIGYKGLGSIHADDAQLIWSTLEQTHEMSLDELANSYRSLDKTGDSELTALAKSISVDIDSNQSLLTTYPTH